MGGHLIPIEICPTSNETTLHLPSIKDHPTLEWILKSDHPVCISTDDSGVFNTTLSREYARVAHSFGLSKDRMGLLAVKSFDYAFADTATLHPLKEAAAETLYSKLLEP